MHKVWKRLRFGRVSILRAGPKGAGVLTHAAHAFVPKPKVDDQISDDIGLVLRLRQGD